MIAIAKETVIPEVPAQQQGFRKRIRLDAPLYAQPDIPCSITIAVKGRVPVFANSDVAAAAVSVLRERAEVTGVQIFAY